MPWPVKPLGLVADGGATRRAEEVLRTTYSTALGITQTSMRRVLVAHAIADGFADLGLRLGLFGGRLPGQRDCNGEDSPKAVLQYIEHMDHELFLCNFRHSQIRTMLEPARCGGIAQSLVHAAPTDLSPDEQRPPMLWQGEIRRELSSRISEWVGVAATPLRWGLLL